MKKFGLEKGTPHLNIYFHCKSPFRFSTLKRRFPKARVENVEGTPEQVRNYIAKGEKWEGTEKAKTIIENSFIEWGELPKSYKEKKQAVMTQVVEAVKDGTNIIDIIEKYPSMALKIKQLNELRQKYLEQQYLGKTRDVLVIYLYRCTAEQVNQEKLLKNMALMYID